MTALANTSSNCKRQTHPLVREDVTQGLHWSYVSSSLVPRRVVNREPQTNPGSDGRDCMKCAVKMGSDSMLYVSNFMKIGSGIQKLMKEINSHTDRKVIS
jgi:hypothetical protein